VSSDWIQKNSHASVALFSFTLNVQRGGLLYYTRKAIKQISEMERNDSLLPAYRIGVYSNTNFKTAYQCFVLCQQLTLITKSLIARGKLCSMMASVSLNQKERGCAEWGAVSDR
jgi:hypothetical protein